jgi:ribonuclease HI
MTIFTDGSGHEHGIRAAAIMVRNGHPIDSLHYYLGKDESHTIYEAEAIAVLLALHMLCKVK